MPQNFCFLILILQFKILVQILVSDCCFAHLFTTRFENYHKAEWVNLSVKSHRGVELIVPSYCAFTSYGVYISQLIRFARASSYVTDFNTRNKLLTQKLLKQGYRYHKLRKTFSKFYRRYYDLISKFQVGLKSLLRQGLSEPDFYGDLVYKLKKIVGSNNFSAQFIKIISHYKKNWL